MERLEEYADEESPVTIPEDLTTNSSELLQTVKDLKYEMEFVKRENERIPTAQEELNWIITENFQTEGRGRRTES